MNVGVCICSHDCGGVAGCGGGERNAIGGGGGGGDSSGGRNYICRGRGRWQCFGQGPLGSERHQMAGQMVEKQMAKPGCKVIGFN